MENIYSLTVSLLENLEQLHAKHKSWTGVSFPRIAANINYARDFLKKPRATDQDISSIVSILNHKPSDNVDPKTTKALKEISDRYYELCKELDPETAAHTAKCEWLNNELSKMFNPC